MLLFTHPAMLDHTVPRGHAEHPGRLEAVLTGLSTFDLDRREAPCVTRAALERVHRPQFLNQMDAAFPAQGYVALDPDTFLSRGSREAALRAAGAVVAAVDAVLNGEDATAFCAVRPPGHHAEPDRAMGFCIYNNVAIGALHALDARGLGKVAVVDFDVHHGNGTQTIAESDPRLFFASTHEWPQYPGTGAAHETGIDGNVLNIPLPAGTAGPAWRREMERQVLPALEAFAPELVLVSAGFDAHEADPLAQLALTEADYGWAGRALLETSKATHRGRIVSTLEGGYDLGALSRSSAAFVSALLAGQGAP